MGETGSVAQWYRLTSLQPPVLSKAFLSSLLVLPSCRMLIVFGTNPKMLSQWELAQLCAARPMSSQHTHRRCSAPCWTSAQLSQHWCKASPGRQSLVFPKKGHSPTPIPKHNVRGNAVVRKCSVGPVGCLIISPLTLKLHRINLIAHTFKDTWPKFSKPTWIHTSTWLKIKWNLCLKFSTAGCRKCTRSLPSYHPKNSLPGILGREKQNRECYIEVLITFLL